MGAEHRQIAIEGRHLKPRHQPQQIHELDGAGGLDQLAIDYRDRRRGLVAGLAEAGGGNYHRQFAEELGLGHELFRRQGLAAPQATGQQSP